MAGRPAHVVQPHLHVEASTQREALDYQIEKAPGYTPESLPGGSLYIAPWQFFVTFLGRLECQVTLSKVNRDIH